MHVRAIPGYNPDKKERDREARILAEIEARAGNVQDK